MLTLQVHPPAHVGIDVWECRFTSATITIGRASTSDVRLQDPRRLVSNRHAEIRTANGQYVLVDAGSTNGTRVNARRLDIGEQYTLQVGDHIAIGQFIIHCQAIAPEDPCPVVPCVVEVPVPPPLPIAEEAADRLAAQLRWVYADSASRGAEIREQRLLALLREHTSPLSRTAAEPLLSAVEQIFASPREPALPCQPRESPVAAVMPLALNGSGSSVAEQAALEGCLNVIKRYCQSGEGTATAERIHEVMQRLDRCFGVTIKALADALNGRRRFEKEFDVEVTRILSTRQNHIKMADSAEEIGAYLLDPGKEADLGTVVNNLEQVFQDLLFHQLGLVAGFRECLRGLLNELKPEKLAAEASEASGKVGRLGRPSASAAWERFKQKHQELCEEEVKVFERILAPHFAKGYLSVQRTGLRSM